VLDRDYVYRVIMGNHPYGLTPEEETQVTRYWFITGLMLGAFISGVLAHTLG